MVTVRKKADIIKLMERFHRIEVQNEVLIIQIKSSIRSGDIEKAETARRRLKINIDQMKDILKITDKEQKPTKLSTG
jgi:hypothetical protein